MPRHFLYLQRVPEGCTKIVLVLLVEVCPFVLNLGDPLHILLHAPVAAKMRDTVLADLQPAKQNVRSFCHVAPLALAVTVVKFTNRR